MSRYHKYSKEQLDFLKENVEGITYRELTKQFNDRFNLSIDHLRIKAMCGRLKLSNKLVGGPKGIKAHNSLPVGSTRIHDGYKWIKVSDTGNRVTDWMFMHIFLWELYYGKKPEDKWLLFIDGDNNNIVIDNLILVDSSTRSRFIQHGLKSNDIEVNRALLQIIEIESLIDSVVEDSY